jgi:hypothetical protein
VFDQESHFEWLLIFLANRFNSAYYLLLIAGNGPVVRPVKARVGVLAVFETFQIAEAPKFMLRACTAAGTEESFRLGHFFHAC